MPKKKFYRLDDSDLKHVDESAKPTHKPATPEEFAKLRKNLEAKLKADVAKIVGKGASARRVKKK
jgi:5,10-methylene-tetrahydrofolate dehydrogenase/methenyl tetrahydrofolate cyclohydrolase